MDFNRAHYEPSLLTVQHEKKGGRILPAFSYQPDPHYFQYFREIQNANGIPANPQETGISVGAGRGVPV